MAYNLHLEGLSLLRKALLVGVVASLVIGIGNAATSLGGLFGPRALTGAYMISAVISIIGILINLYAWFLQYNGWDRLCRTQIENFFCTTTLAVKWGLLASIVLSFLGQLVMLSTIMSIGARPGAGLGIFGVMTAGGGLLGLAGLIGLVVAIITLIAYFKIAEIYKSDNVKWGAILVVVGVLLTFIGIGVIIIIVGYILLYMGLGDAISNVSRLGIGGQAPPPPPPPPPSY